MGYSPRGRKESDTTERLHFTSLPCFLTAMVHVINVLVVQLVSIPLIFIPNRSHTLVKYSPLYMSPDLGGCNPR